MNLASKISLATAAIAATLAIACNFFESNDAVNTTPSPTRIEQTTPAIDATSHISNVPSPTLRLDPDRQPVQHQPRSTRTEPTPLNEADQKLTEDKRWCQAWALENLDPHVYFEFAKLDPANMDDLQRTVWRKQLASSGANTDLPTYRQEASHPMPIGGDDKNEKTCRVYWAEPLSKANADKRNRQHETGCLYGLALEADRKWAELAQAAVRGGDTAAYDIPNQYVRVLRWMHLTGDEILNMTEPPSELLKRLSDKKYAYNSNIPSTSDITNLKAQHGDDFSADWWNLVGATLAQNHRRAEACPIYYPQLFYGYWVPFAEPDSDDDEQEIPAEIAAAIADQMRRLLEGPLYLPRPYP